MLRNIYAHTHVLGFCLTCFFHTHCGINWVHQRVLPSTISVQYYECYCTLLRVGLLFSVHTVNKFNKFNIQLCVSVLESNSSAQLGTSLGVVSMQGWHDTILHSARCQVSVLEPVTLLITSKFTIATISHSQKSISNWYMKLTWIYFQLP